jgi:hypothetical protein
MAGWFCAPAAKWRIYWLLPLRTDVAVSVFLFLQYKKDAQNDREASVRATFDSDLLDVWRDSANRPSQELARYGKWLFFFFAKGLLLVGEDGSQLITLRHAVSLICTGNTLPSWKSSFSLAVGSFPRSSLHVAGAWK